MPLHRHDPRYGASRLPHAALGITPVPQTVWGWLAVGNFFLGGTGAGAYVLAVLLHALVGAPAVSAVAVAAAACVLGGFGCVALEAGRPLRGLRVLTNLRHSWISRELLAGLLFVLLALSNALWPQRLVQALAAAVALLFLVSQGLILVHARGVPAWQQRHLPWLWLSSGLLTGLALLLGLTLLGPPEAAAWPFLGGMGVGLTLVDLGLWLAYLLQPVTSAALAQSLRRLTTPWLLGGMVGVGHILPLLLLGAALLASPLRPVVLPAACAALFLGGLLLKHSLVIKAGYRLGLPLPSLQTSTLQPVERTAHPLPPPGDRQNR